MGKSNTENEKLMTVFCELFYEFILDELADKALFSDFKNPILLPIPSSKKRSKERGYNQCEFVASELARIDGNKNFTAPENILEKIKDSPSQTSVKNRAKRLQNLKGCFAAGDSEKNPKCQYNSRRRCHHDRRHDGGSEKTLMNAGARQVICFALAH